MIRLFSTSNSNIQQQICTHSSNPIMFRTTLVSSTTINSLSKQLFSTNSVATLRRELRQHKEIADRTALATVLSCENNNSSITEAITKAANNLLDQAISSSTNPPFHTLQVRRCPPPLDRGDGVFATSSTIPKGTALCFYGGILYTGNEVNWLGGSPTCFQQSDPNFIQGDVTSPTNLSYLLGCSSGSVINGAPVLNNLGVDVHVEGKEENITMSHRGQNAKTIGWDPRQTSDCLIALKEREMPNGKPNTKTIDTTQWENRIRNDSWYSMGSKINHPPLGETVNVVGWPVDLEILSKEKEKEDDDNDDDKDLFTPCVYAVRGSYCEIKPFVYRIGSDKAICSKQTVVFVAVKDIKKGDELFLDYNVEASVAEAPKWYSPADVLEIE